MLLPPFHRWKCKASQLQCQLSSHVLSVEALALWCIKSAVTVQCDWGGTGGQDICSLCRLHMPGAGVLEAFELIQDPSMKLRNRLMCHIPLLSCPAWLFWNSAVHTGSQCPFLGWLCCLASQQDCTSSGANNSAFSLNRTVGASPELEQSRPVMMTTSCLDGRVYGLLVFFWLSQSNPGTFFWCDFQRSPSRVTVGHKLCSPALDVCLIPLWLMYGRIPAWPVFCVYI